MYLRSLEIQGFKSFPDKTRLVFDKPITAVVGPNGSGKSNISDAILWVMGEQSSKTLRGGKMEDVIFGGTEKRPPVGFAEVSLIIENGARLFDIDSAEVMITRRYYRSGESEYFINKQLVRLKDVNELLMDTGLGREGYSIIGQGKIDGILSVKSGDRREIFEEAAGISRFRHRKEEAERKLAQTDENLLRIGDKISELEYQVEPLRAQAETAKKYLILRDELRGHEIAVWTDSLLGLEAQSVKLRADTETAEGDLGRATAELEALYQKAELFMERVREKDVESEENRQKLAALETERAELTSQVRVLHAKLENNALRIEQIGQELLEHDGRDGGIKAQIEERTKRLEEIGRQRGLLARDAESLMGEMETLGQTAGAAAQRLSGLFRSENETVTEIGERRAALSALSSSAQAMLDRESALAAELGALQDRIALQAEETRRCTEQYEAANARATELKNAVSGYAMRLDSRRKKAASTGEKKSHLTQELGAIRSRIAMLTELERDYEGYSRAVKIVMQEAARGALRGIHGTVGSLVETEDQYAVAIETALGAGMQNIVVGSEGDGKGAIQMLRRRDAGRATFLPLTTIRGSVLGDRGLEAEDGVEGIAVRLVRFDEKYGEVFRSLLGRIVIVRNLDDAIRISRKYGARFRIVTLDGQVMNTGGSMTGGSTSRQSGVISRANELKRLTEQASVLDGALEDAARAYEEAAREAEAAEYELETARGEMRVQEDALIRLESEKSHCALLEAAATESLLALREESARIEGQIAENGKATEAVSREISALTEALSALRAEIEGATAGQETLTAEKERLSAALSKVRAEAASLDAEGDALQNAVSELSALRADLTGGRQQQQTLREELTDANQAILAEIARHEAAGQGLEAQMRAHRDRISAITAEKLDLEAERTRSDKDMQEKNRMLLELDRERARLEQRLLACEMEEKQLVDKLWDTYELTRSVAMEIRTVPDNIAETKRRIGELRREIGKLGTPNIGAIDEFERVNTRYMYLTTQRDDVEKAKAELMIIIADITAEMRNIFAKQFHLINESFKETFLELFGGGQASLELEDAEDILNCGIEIRVQPPGKALKTLTLLSGGEKAFVAIALYFAILKVRPTPFVVMDEIEAALDEANVQRFAQYMRRMSEKSQMIIISHRRGTIEEADVLYGVTMQEQGVSRILAIDLEEAEKSLK